MKRFIFLDIDGTLASIPFLCRRAGYIDPECVKILNTLSDINPEIVISSSWGYDNGKTEKALRECGLTLPIVGYTEHFNAEWTCRGNEIEKWLREHVGGMCTKYGKCKADGIPYHRKNYDHLNYEYVIFDDDTDFLLGQKDNFIQVDDNTGLTMEDVNKAREILLREY